MGVVCGRMETLGTKVNGGFYDELDRVTEPLGRKGDRTRRSRSFEW